MNYILEHDFQDDRYTSRPDAQDAMGTGKVQMSEIIYSRHVNLLDIEIREPCRTDKLQSHKETSLGVSIKHLYDIPRYVCMVC